jgi:hypothetical protein
VLPVARRDKLTVRELPDETLIYDRERSKAHCLNRTAAFIWRHCDGQTSLRGLAALVEKELGIGQGEAVVRLALEQLSTRALLEEPVTPLSAAQRLSRRDALRKVAVAAAVIPVVMTLTARSARSQGISNGQCRSSLDCPPSGECFISFCSLPGSPRSRCGTEARNEGQSCNHGTGVCGFGNCVPKTCTGTCEDGTGNCSPGCACPASGNGACVSAV